MQVSRILAELRSERERIDKAIAALTALESTPTAASKGRQPGRKRHMSAAARKRISEMMKKRWAERKKRAKGA